MFFLFIAILDTLATILIGIIDASSNAFKVNGFVYFSLFINCIFWFSLYSMWAKCQYNKNTLSELKKYLNECRKELKLPLIKEDETIEELPNYNPFFNPYLEENGIEIEEYDEED